MVCYVFAQVAKAQELQMRLRRARSKSIDIEADLDDYDLRYAFVKYRKENGFFSILVKVFTMDFPKSKMAFQDRNPFQPCLPIHAMLNFTNIYRTEQHFTGLWISESLIWHQYWTIGINS